MRGLWKRKNVVEIVVRGRRYRMDNMIFYLSLTTLVICAFILGYLLAKFKHSKIINTYVYNENTGEIVDSTQIKT